MEIVKQRSEKFERELRGLKSLNKNAIESAAQKFKDELMDNVRKQLTEKKLFQRRRTAPGSKKITCQVFAEGRCLSTLYSVS